MQTLQYAERKHVRKFRNVLKCIYIERSEDESREWHINWHWHGYIKESEGKIVSLLKPVQNSAVTLKYIKP